MSLLREYLSATEFAINHDTDDKVTSNVPRVSIGVF